MSFHTQNVKSKVRQVMWMGKNDRNKCRWSGENGQEIAHGEQWCATSIPMHTKHAKCPLEGRTPFGYIPELKSKGL